MQKNKTKTSVGSRNLILLGIGSILVAVLTTSVSLFLYHDSGDIYLDRSRPGFLPEESEIEETKKTTNYEFPENVNLTEKVVDNFLENYQTQIDYINSFSEPYNPNILSDESLGFPE